MLNGKGGGLVGYRIEYGSGMAKRRKVRQRRIPALWLVLCAAAAALMIPGVRMALWQWMLPGDGVVTAEALGELVTNLREGESFGEAVSVFCREIIAHGAV